jgi:hypothetical protein
MYYEISYYSESYEKMLVEASAPEEAVLKVYRHANTPYMSVNGHGDYRVVKSLDGQVRVIQLRESPKKYCCKL